MREVDITEECLSFIDSQDERVSLKFFQLIEVIGEIKVVNSNFLKRLQSTQFYELRIKAGNEYRVINFAECTKAVCLCGFLKKSTKDYKRAIKQAEKILKEYLKEK
ncbi:type II toxin-antitoxin system RelE/ParE family toxin [Aequorivita capsosiphonis]|uniref:type II toxin-antitoxin system RelE/ParE family toxin n=1 Tax=Aequorivita capsosiphonis TaxID=487317 RepID=UPI000479EB47|nr:type II toxin-antitoxin system RelE/ParE family toxin [Aequorivita capsosiphonis]